MLDKQLPDTSWSTFRQKVLVMYSRLIPDLLSCLRSMRPLSRRSRRNRSGLFIPEHLEKRELLSVTPVLVADINDTTVSGLDAPELPLFG